MRREEDRRVEQHEPLDGAGMTGRVLEGEPCAERVPEPDRRVSDRTLDGVEMVFETPGRLPRGAAVTEEVGRQQAMPAREVRREPREMASPTRDPVEAHDGGRALVAPRVDVQARHGRRRPSGPCALSLVRPGRSCERPGVGARNDIAVRRSGPRPPRGEQAPLKSRYRGIRDESALASCRLRVGGGTGSVRKGARVGTSRNARRVTPAPVVPPTVTARAPITRASPAGARLTLRRVPASRATRGPSRSGACPYP